MDERTNNNREQDHLSGRIADTLRDHAESYSEGAWERFEARHLGIPSRSVSPGKRLWKWSAAAAVLLFASLSWWFVGHQAGQSDPVLVQEPPAVHESPAVTRESPVVVMESASGLEDFRQGDPRVEGPAEATTMVVASGQPFPGSVEQGPDESRKTLPVTRSILGSIQRGSLESLEHSVSDRVKIPMSSLLRKHFSVTEPNHFERLAAVAMLSSDSENAGSSERYLGKGKTPDKWNISLALASAMTSEQLNFGTGISVAYRLSDRVSVGSGLGFGRMGVNKEGFRIGLARGERSISGPASPAGPASGPVAAPGPNTGVGGSDPNISTGVKSVNAIKYARRLLEETSELLILDIPFDFTYSVTERFYASTGLSLMQVLQESRTFHFVDFSSTAVSEVFHENADMYQYSGKVFSVNQPSQKRPLQDIGYSGFLNFSLGHKTPLSKKITLSVEPFLKLPIGKISRDEMNLTNGGIRIVTGF